MQIENLAKHTEGDESSIVYRPQEEHLHLRSSIRNRHGFYSELYTDEEIKHLARAFRKKRGDKRVGATDRSPLLDEQKFLRIVILRLARSLFGIAEQAVGAQHVVPLRFGKDELTTFEKILSAIGHLATLERVRIAAEGGKGEEEGDSIFEALAAMDHSKL